MLVNQFFAKYLTGARYDYNSCAVAPENGIPYFDDVQAILIRSRHRNMAESVMAIDIAGLVDTKRGLIGRPIFIGRAGVSARYRIPNPLDIWRRVLDWVSALYSMTAEVLQYRRYRSPPCLHL